MGYESIANQHPGNAENKKMLQTTHSSHLVLNIAKHTPLPEDRNYKTDKRVLSMQNWPLEVFSFHNSFNF